MGFLGLYNYWVFILLLACGLYTVIVRANMVKRVIGLTIFQSSVFLLFITMDKLEGGTAPIIVDATAEGLYANPLPQVLILTAIVVGISVTALALALIIRIKEEYGTIEESQTLRMDSEA